MRRASDCSPVAKPGPCCIRLHVTGRPEVYDRPCAPSRPARTIPARRCPARTCRARRIPDRRIFRAAGIFRRGREQGYLSPALASGGAPPGASRTHAARKRMRCMPLAASCRHAACRHASACGQCSHAGMRSKAPSAPVLALAWASLSVCASWCLRARVRAALRVWLRELVIPCLPCGRIGDGQRLTAHGQACGRRPACVGRASIGARALARLALASPL